MEAAGLNLYPHHVVHSSHQSKLLVPASLTAPPLDRSWLAITLGHLWLHNDQARWSGVRDMAHDKLLTLLEDEVPEVRRSTQGGSGRGSLEGAVGAGTQGKTVIWGRVYLFGCSEAVFGHPFVQLSRLGGLTPSRMYMYRSLLYVYLAVPVYLTKSSACVLPVCLPVCRVSASHPVAGQM